MTNKKRTSRFSLFQFIIALVFVGYAANSMGWTEQYLGYAKTLFWKPVSVELTSLAIDEKAKTGITAEYQYRYNGQRYTSQKIRAVDKNWLDSDQALEIYTSLRSQRNSGKVQGWLNPEQPKQVVLDRNILHVDALASSLFTLAFLAMPLLMALLPLLFRRKQKTEPELKAEERTKIHQKKVVDLIEQPVITSQHQAESEQDALQQISLENLGTLDNPQGVKLYSRAMRMLGAKIPFILTGSIFFSIGIYFQNETDGLGIIFSIVGALSVLIGLWLAGKQLEAIITNGRVQVTRRWAGIRLSQTDYPFTSLQQLVLKEGARITANGKHTQMMALAIEHQGKLKTIAEGIQGQEPAKALKYLLIKKLSEVQSSTEKAA
ncbi:DUF3592 domain-containing protein [Pelagibaculum spongiae]|uniref:DUF3592 domain-containing protein n=1 Tax=Pelagibaculum spongiae TaxID=2080658 RepID=A0A2V1GQP1_9GAMM|nr:DUF3592 domain-containing protein [Pelagibaculum spongiae]PVZ65614.1 hypothetical protein DC094_17155 [Pelagibaculum spongiae]